MKKIVLSLLIVILISCKSDNKQVEKTSELEVKSYTYKTLEPILNRQDNKTYIINFWATWCKPCVEELPVFEKIGELYKNKNVESGFR